MRGGEERKCREEIRKEVRGGKEKIREGMETGGRMGRGKKEGRRMEGNVLEYGGVENEG